MKSWKEVKITPLSNEDTKRVLNSCVNNEERKRQLQSSSHLDIIAKLCDCVPLALFIVGSLLSDYPGEMLIEHLEKEPMDIILRLLEIGFPRFQCNPNVKHISLIFKR